MTPTLLSQRLIVRLTQIENMASVPVIPIPGTGGYPMIGLGTFTIFEKTVRLHHLELLWRKPQLYLWINNLLFAGGQE